MSGTDSITPEGFFWGPVHVARIAEWDRGKKGITRMLRLVSLRDDVEVYITPIGLMRCFRQGQELTVPGREA